MNAAKTPDLVGIANRLLNEQGLGNVTSIEPLAGGRNNRVFLLKGPAGQWLLKQYFLSPDGGRDRCGSEWIWSSFCWDNGIRSIAQPIATSRAEHCSLFEFIEGRHLQRDEINATHVDQAAAFVTEVNRHRQTASAQTIPEAAEACFSIRQHLDCIEHRIQRLQSLSVFDPLDQQLQDWIATALLPEWKSIASQIEATVGLDRLVETLPPSDRCLSPSDFGFHNALLTPDGRLKFLDFEYAGWDDPAKLVCDFYFQQHCPVPRATKPPLISALVNDADRPVLEPRIDLLTPVYGIKWCCLILNEFLTPDRARREFAQSEPVTTNQREAQLERAKRLLIELQNR